MPRRGAEGVWALRRSIHAETEQARCLTLITNAVITWTTEYYAMRRSGRRIGCRAFVTRLLRPPPEPGGPVWSMSLNRAGARCHP
jgi:hypothetical protein